MLAGNGHRTRNRDRHRTTHADRTIENRVDSPQERSSESRKTVRKKVVERFAFIDAANFYVSALVNSVHMEELLEALLEPFAELFLELLLQPFEIFFEEGYTSLKGAAKGDLGLTILDLHSPAEQLHPSSPGCPGDQFGFFQGLQHPLNLLEIGKIVHPLRPSAQLADGLRSPQHQDAEQRHFPPPEIKYLAKTMGELLYAMARTTYADYKMFVFKSFERLFHRPLIKLHHRITARFLITGIL
jgi:hypothetical protein